MLFRKIMLKTRNAVLPDVEHIHAIIEPYAEKGVLLPRSTAELCENIRDFVVAEEDGQVVGCGALHLYGMHLAEIRSIAVSPEKKSRGIGRLLVDALMAGITRAVSHLCLPVHSNARILQAPGFNGVAQRQDLPDKIYKDCVHCPKLTDCDEVAMIIGKIPQNTNGLRDPRIAIPLVTLKAR